MSFWFVKWFEKYFPINEFCQREYFNKAINWLHSHFSMEIRSKTFVSGREWKVWKHEKIKSLGRHQSLLNGNLTNSSNWLFSTITRMFMNSSNVFDVLKTTFINWNFVESYVNFVHFICSLKRFNWNRKVFPDNYNGDGFYQAFSFRFSMITFRNVQLIHHVSLLQKWNVMCDINFPLNHKMCLLCAFSQKKVLITIHKMIYSWFCSQHWDLCECQSERKIVDASWG